MKQQIEDLTMDKFFKNRDELIDKFAHGRMSKTEFVEENYAFIMSLKFSPFEGDLKDHRKCIYNYQYYNILAKYCNLQAQELENFDPKGAEKFKVDEFEYYKYKDQATLSLLEFVDYQNVDSYFMNLASNRLCGSLYEIVFKDYNRAIFHSMNPAILKKLRDKKVFSPVYKDSVIHTYVNSVY